MGAISRRNSTPPPSAARVEIDHPKEIEPAEGPVLVRLRPFFGPGRERPWYIYRGDCRGVASDGRRNERVRVEVPSLGIVLSIPWNCIGATPSTSQHRLPAGWLTQYLNTNPDDLEAAGSKLFASQSRTSDGWKIGTDQQYAPQELQPCPPSREINLAG